MTFIAESKVSSAACARYYDITQDQIASVGLILKPQSSATWGDSGNWSYNSTTGLFTLSSSHIYHIEADVFAARQGGVLAYGTVICGFTDSGGTELTDSARGGGLYQSCERYYNSFTKVNDQTAYAVIDGSTVSSFYWKILVLEKTTTVTVYLDALSQNGGSSWGLSGSRLIIREYPA